ncbi:very short patch repair endonuclease [Corallococcus sp. AS-1-6]|uniref:very short patch repair endonuclease n=1 Tax=Corallococcus sp. AS-1-6 TaxID=2874599 RepID=UPI001CC0889D|nr:very short patch repair endonuclease [Corallococcus sp. AS-1-6]
MDKISRKRRSANMSRIRAKDTQPEVLVRRIVHAAGYRFRLHRRDLPGRPDLVFPGLRKIIQVHGCFWHQHARCVDGRVPRSNAGYWGPKLERNKQRDVEVERALTKLGWSVLTVWECETAKPDLVAERVLQFLGASGGGGTSMQNPPFGAG